MQQVYNYLFIRPFVKFGLILIQLFFFLYAGLIPAWRSVNSDFPNYYTSSRMLKERADLSQLYNNERFNEQIHAYGIDQQGKFAPFPPPTAFVMLPLSGFDPLTAKRIWTCVNLLLLAFSIFLFRKISDLSLSSSLLFFLAGGMALVNNFYLGQIYLLILIGMQLSWLLSKRSPIIAGLITSAGMSLKYFPLVILPSWILEKNKKALLWTFIGIALISLASFAFIGQQACTDFVSSVLGKHLNSHLDGQSPYAAAFQSWDAFLMNVFVKDATYNPSPLIDSPSMFFIAKFAIIIFFVVLTARTLLVLKNHPHRSEYSLILFSFLIAVLSPASASYHFLLLLMPIALLLKIHSEVRVVVITFFFVLFCGFCGVMVNGLPGHNLVLDFWRLWGMSGYFLYLSFCFPQIAQK